MTERRPPLECFVCGQRGYAVNMEMLGGIRYCQDCLRGTDSRAAEEAIRALKAATTR